MDSGFGLHFPLLGNQALSLDAREQRSSDGFPPVQLKCHGYIDDVSKLRSFFHQDKRKECTDLMICITKDKNPIIVIDFNAQKRTFFSQH